MIGQNNSFKRIYSGAHDGFKCENFHKCCDKKGATLTIVTSTNNKVFGGYTPIPWRSKEEDYGVKGKCKSFLFAK